MKDKKIEFKELYRFVQLVGNFEKFDLGKTSAPIYIFSTAAPGVAVLFNFDEFYVRVVKKGGVPNWVVAALKV